MKVALVPADAEFKEPQTHAAGAKLDWSEVLDAIKQLRPGGPFVEIADIVPEGVTNREKNAIIHRARLSLNRFLSKQKLRDGTPLLDRVIVGRTSNGLGVKLR